MSELNEHLQWIADYIANNDKNYVGGVFERDDSGEEFTLSINKADAMRNLSEQNDQLKVDLDESDTEFKNAMQLVKAKNEEIAQLQAEKVELIELVKSSFMEGYSLGYSDGNSDGQSYTGRSCRDDAEQWKTSESIDLLNKLQ